MQWTPKIRRRAFGVVCVVAAILLLIFGDTKLQPGQSHSAFLVYWLACFAFAALAMITAIRDAGALRREVREQQRELLENTFQNIESEKQRRSHAANPASDSAHLRD